MVAAKSVSCFIFCSILLMAWITVGVIPSAERVADLRKAGRREFPAQVHGDLARISHGVGPFARLHVGQLQVETGRDGFLDQINADGPGLGLQEVTQRLFGQVQVDLLVQEAVTTRFNLKLSDMKARKRTDAVAYPRPGDWPCP